MSQFISNSWDIVGSDFPAEGTTVEHIQFLLNYAVLAPSRHNIQPWLFKVEGNTVALYADQSRALPVADADNREMIISCGAALANLLFLPYLWLIMLAVLSFAAAQSASATSCY